MRNLKKILALVLALVMSLSLMATASAADFTDASSINDTYETAVEVLSGLGVFNGYKEDGSFRPQGSITRAETAAIIYRIVTGDVEDKQVGIYADYNIFTDVPSTAWYAGYVNFCANAEYIKGVGGGKFNPQGQVTGYAALAMILRAIGYTANGGFTGPEWEVQTARTAADRKITKNINTGTLGQPATRETVAEILFQAILVNMVDHNVDNTFNGNQGYTEIDMTLGYKTFKLEQIEGVVTGNEFADLKSTQVLDNGKTQLETKDGVRDLAITTKITDVGESRYAYITGTKVLAMGDTGLNKVTEFGHACEIDTPTKFRAAAEMPAATDMEYYVNFGRVGTYTCDQRLEFQVTFQTAAAEASFNAYIGNNIARIAADEPGTWTITWTPTAPNYPVTYNKVIRANNDISDDDLDVIRGIFGAADNQMNNGFATDQITGDVFIGTMSTNTAATNEERDLSNSISYNKFFAEYINPVVYDINWDESANGEWVKFVDNNGDGLCDYAFLTESWLDEAIDTYTNKDGDTVTAFVLFNDDDTRWIDGWTSVRYMDGSAPAVGTKVICSLIDNQILVEPAKNETVTVTDYNWRTDIINTDKGEYGQSGIDWADLGLQYFINTMADKTAYIVYFDHFGYVRAYDLPGDTTYALITEIYARNNMNGNLEQNWPMTVELTVKDAETAEYNLNGGNRNLFVSPNWWTQVNNYSAQGNYYNWLKPAVAHLGVPAATGYGPTLATNVTPNPLSAWYSFWPWNRQVAFEINSMTKNDTFDYGPATKLDGSLTTIAAGQPGGPKNTASTSFTNVAVTKIDGENATLEGAAKLRLDGRGNVMWYDTNNDGNWDLGELPRYAVDYVQLTKEDTVAGQTRYPIDTANYTGWVGNAANNYVSATHNTEYYIVFEGGVYYFTDYTKMPELTAENNIHAAYAVARDTSADNASAPYWVADVIVYEVENWIDTSRTSTALVYYNPSRNDAQVQRLNVLDSVNGKVDAIPGGIPWNSNLGYWNNFANYSGLGFYQFWDGNMKENGDLAVGDIVYIDGYDHSACTSVCAHGVATCVPGADLRWNSNLIYAGTVVNEVEVATNGTYLNVDTDGDGNTNVSLLVKPSAESNVYSVTTDYEVTSRWNYNEANTLRYNNIQTSQIKAGDRIVWVSVKDPVDVDGWNNTNNAAFVVDLGNQNNNWAIWNNTASFLAQYPTPNTTDLDPNAGLWLDIMNEQQTPVAPAAITRTLTLRLGAGRAVTEIPPEAKITDVFSSITVTAAGQTKPMVSADGGNAYTCEFTFADGKEPAMYSYSYVLAPGYAAADAVVEFTSDDATFDNTAKVFVPKAGVATITVALVNESVEYDSDNIGPDEVRVAKEEALNLVDEYVTYAISQLDEDEQKIVEANMSGIDSAVAAAKAAINAIDADSAAVSDVTDLISKTVTDGTTTWAGTQLSSIDSAIQAPITAVTSAIEGKEADLRALVSTLNSEAAATVLKDGLPELKAATTTAQVTSIGNKIEKAMRTAATPDATPLDPSELPTGTGDDFGSGGDFEGLQAYVTKASDVIKSTTEPNTYTVVVDFPMTKTFNKTSPGPFNGFGDGNGAAAITSAFGIPSGDQQDGIWFGFVAFQIEGSDTVVIAVGAKNAEADHDYTSHTTVTVGGTTTVTVNFQYTFA